MSKIVKFCIFEKHGGICEKYNSYCHLGACPYEDMREFELTKAAAKTNVMEELIEKSSKVSNNLKYCVDSDIVNDCSKCIYKKNGCIHKLMLDAKEMIDSFIKEVNKWQELKSSQKM